MLHPVLVSPDVHGAVSKPRGAAALPVAVAPLSRVIQPLEGVVGKVVDDAVAMRDVAAAEALSSSHHALVQARVEIAIVQEELKK